MKRLDVTGERYGRLVAMKRLTGVSPSRWVFKCDCGNRCEASLSNVRSGQIQSCGCAGSRNTVGERSLKHGHGVGFRKSRTATAWRNAKTRCFNPNNNRFDAYGGRGITMCKEWSEDFSAFLRDMGECPSGLSLDRIDVNGNYEPGNCRWATQREQMANTRMNVYVETSEGRVILKEFAAANSVSYKSLHRRVKKLGESPESAMDWLLKKAARRHHSERSKRPSSTHRSRA